MTDGTATNAPPRPVVADVDPEEVAPGVHVIPDGRVPLVPNIGIVVGDRAALVVDTGMGPVNGTRVLDKARALTDKPLLLTITHFHPEHGFGAQVFDGVATIVYNREQADELTAKGPRYVEMFRGFGDAVAEQLEGVELVSAHVTYDGRAKIDLGGVSVELSQVGPAHTRGDQLVLVRERRVVFTGDLVENRLFPIFPWFPPDDADVSGERWIATLERFESMPVDVVVPGHGEPGGLELVRAARAYMADVQGRVRGEGSTRSIDDVKAKLEPQIRESYPDWDAPEWIGFAIECFHAELHG
ncbi:MAG TPA: MBL fold metallo-hydrolase [Gaiellaceae bacterium]|nr:MBL fold metallo-hydrolase [Gaiellaceae bacterium]